MIYLVQSPGYMTDYLTTSSVFEVEDGLDVRALYKLFMERKATALNITINPHWLNVMDHKLYHGHLTSQEYKAKCKEWSKVLNYWKVQRYIVEELGGKKLEFKLIHNYTP